MNTNLNLGRGRSMVFQPKDQADKQLDQYELERDESFLDEPALPAGVCLAAVQTCAVV
jgi:hypothetical protein